MHNPCKSTKLNAVAFWAIGYEVQQQCCRLTCNILKQADASFVYLIMFTRADMYTCLLNYVYMQDNYVYMQDNYVYMYT